MSNISGAMGRTSTFALSRVTHPWVPEIANRGPLRPAQDLRPVARAINVFEAEWTSRAVAESFPMPYISGFDC